MIKLGKGFKKYFSNTTWLLGGRVIRMIGAFCVGIYVIRYLGPENLGKLTYSAMLVGLFMMIGNLGLPKIVVRELIEYPDRNNSILGTAAILTSVGTVFAWILIAIYLYLFESDTDIQLYVAIFAFFRILLVFNGIHSYFESIVQSKYNVIVAVSAMTIILATRLILVQFEAELILFILTYSLELVLFTIGTIYIYHAQGNRIADWKWNSSLAGQLLHNCWPFILTGLAVVIYMRIDQIMIRKMLGIYDVGIYAVAVTLSEAWYFVPNLIAASLFPAVLNARKRDQNLYKERLSNLYQLMFWMAFFVAVVTTFTASFIVPLLYGDIFTPSVTSLCIHVWAGIFVSIGTVNNSHLLAENLQKYLTISVCLGAVINIILNLFLIEKYGIEGAALSTVISYAYASFFGLLIMKTTRHTCILFLKSVFRLKMPKLDV